MRIGWSSLLFSACLAMCCNLFSQKIAFKRISPPTNYPFSLISAMAQDTAGYLWFTSGPVLYRYDGYEYTTYINDPSDSNSIFAENLECILIDREGLIWTGDIFRGLNVLDPKTGKFRHFRYHPVDQHGLPSDHVSALGEDDQGNIWVGTLEGISVYNKQSNTFKHYQHDPADPGSISDNDVISIYRDRHGIMWVCCGGAFRTSGKDRTKGGLNQFNAANGTFVRYMHDPNDVRSISSNLVQTVYEDSRGVFWVGTVGENGLQTLDRNTGKFTRYIYDPANPAKLSRLPIRDNIPYADDHVSFIQEDITGAIWIGTYETGVSRYDPVTNTVARYGVSNDPDSLHENGLWSVFQTRDGMLWMGSWEYGNFNLYLVDPVDRDAVKTIRGVPFYSFYEDENILYAGSSPGLQLLDKKSKKVIKEYYGQRKEVPDRDSLSDGYIYKIIKDRSGMVWLGTDHGGLCSFDPRTEKFRSYQYRKSVHNSIDSGIVVALLEDRNNIFWVGTTNGLNIMDKTAGTFRHIKHDPQNKSSISSNEISSIAEDGNGDIWVGTKMKGGLNRFIRDKNAFEHYLEGLSVDNVFEDTRHVLWVATQNGLYRKEKTSDKFSRYLDYNLRDEEMHIANTMEDNMGNLWVMSFSGIYIIDTGRTSSVFYPLTQNWSIGPVPYLPGISLSTGEILYGFPRGYYQFHAAEFLKKASAPQLVIDNFHFTDKGKNNVPIDPSGETTLSHDQNNFSMKFAGIHFANTAGNIHIYKLENYDESWRKAGSDRTAYFYNVPPGNYTLRVAASNSRGTWTERAFRIIITPPWWSTWWFRIMAMLFVVSILYAIIRRRMRQQFQQKLAQSEREKQLADLRHKTSELEIHALRAQMNPHFIFNSLNSINRFILQNNRSQASEYLTKFSKLVRLVFHNSQSSLIPLDSELEALDLYLELEMLRFDNHFEYHINVDEEVDTSALLVPPLIIQPYTENAIWHGIMHKDDTGHLNIDIKIEEEMLICRIRDDGIGRKNSAEIKSKSGGTHKSMGMRITSDRIALLQQQEMLLNAIQVNDLTLPDGTAGGTEVIIKLPLKYD